METLEMKRPLQEVWRKHTLKQCRIDAGYRTCKLFANHIGIPYDIYVKYENGNNYIKNCPPDTLELILDGLGLKSVDEISDMYSRNNQFPVKRSDKVPLDKLEAELEKKFGKKLEPVRCKWKDRFKLSKASQTAKL